MSYYHKDSGHSTAKRSCKRGNDKRKFDLFNPETLWVNKVQVLQLLNEGWEMGRRSVDNLWLHNNIWIQEGGLLKAGKCFYIRKITLKALLKSGLLVEYPDAEKDWLIRYKLK